MEDFINNLKNSDIWKVQLTMVINFYSSKITDEECIMHSKSDIMQFKIYDHADKVIEELFKSLLNKYQIGLGTSIKGRNFILDCIYLLYYKCHKMNPNPGWSDICSPSWIKNKTVTINSINNDDKCFQYAAPVALNHKQIGKNSK